MVVLDARTGKLKWYYQLPPNDGFDWDLGAAPMLLSDDAGRQLVALGSKDGHVYVLDRASHGLLFKTAITTILNADKKPTPDGVRACPGALGGTAILAVDNPTRIRRHLSNPGRNADFREKQAVAFLTRCQQRATDPNAVVDWLHLLAHVDVESRNPALDTPIAACWSEENETVPRERRGAGSKSQLPRYPST